ncbi:MAG TPA: caspase family protein, partial [Burkholderiaceae bacterium]|nr:caspase family protein [Burkholderiaceae bacterium]
MPRRLLVPVLALLLCLGAPAGAAEPTPVLRIESGTHTAPIRAVSVDAGGRLAVTAAEDKTARVWDLATGRLLQTLRPPAGAGNEGKLYAVAISPDGNLVATGGWSKENEVYLFNRSSGQLVHRVAGLPNVITHLAFSPDGKLLLVSLWGKQGIRLYASEDGWRTAREASADRDYDGESYGADFSRDGQRLVTSSFDGLVRLYSLGPTGAPPLRLLASERLQAGQRPFAVAFSPQAAGAEGHRLAVSFADSPAIAVVDATSLRPAYAPSVAGVGNGNFSALAWSADGRQLLAAGSWKRAEGQHGLRRWADGGRGAFADSTLAANTVVGLRALADGRLLFAAADPAWGVLSPAGERISYTPPGLADFRGDRATFRLAPDGTAASFGLVYGDPQTQAFDFTQMDWAGTGAQLPASQASSREMVLGPWFESTQPMLNQRRIALDTNEVALSAAVNAAGNQLALGTSFHVRYFGRDGKEQWHLPAPGSTWQVSQSQDGRWVVAGFSDGSIRWYRAKDGAEQLAFLPHADRKRWVAWTPQGYYAASPGGEDLIGWHIDRGPLRAADFFAGSRFRANFFRPDVISQVLALGDGAAALRAANEEAGRKLEAARVAQQLPPVVTLLSPVDGGSVAAPEVRIAVTVRAPADAPATSLRVRVNGSVIDVPGGRSLPRAPPGVDEVRHELRVPLPSQDAEVMVFAENRHGFSTPALLRLRWAAPVAQAAPVAPALANARPQAPPRPVAPPAASLIAPSPAAAAGDLRPALYVLAIGVSRYRNPSITLDFPAKDAGDFAAAFKSQVGLYRKVVVKLLTDDGAKRDDVLDGLEWIRREMTSRDVGMVFLAGHGVNDSDGVYYYLPQDVEPDKLKRTGVIFTEIKNTLSALPGKVLFFVDTCHSGNVLGTGRRAIPNDLTAIVNELSSAENGVIVFAASTGRQVAQESPEWGNGAFTKAVVEGVSGLADRGRTGRVTHKMLDLHISERVKELTRGSQSPVTIVPQGVPDFPLVV